MLCCHCHRTGSAENVSRAERHASGKTVLPSCLYGFRRIRGKEETFPTSSGMKWGDEFEDIEHKMFGKDGFEEAEKKISAIETRLGLADLAQFTPPKPPNP
jgi:hypothetical protein